MYALIAGLLFGVGLAVSGMVLPEKVIGFLDITGHWDPSLMFVMGGALAVFIPGYFFLIKKRTVALNGAALNLKKGNQFDAKLIIGSAIFGIGWGLAGICPGPSISVMLLGGLPILGFIIAMLVGMAIAEFVGHLTSEKKETLVSE